MSTTTNTLRMIFTTATEGVNYVLSLKYADPDLKNVGGMAKVQTAATAIIAEQPFDNITLSALSRSELVERTATDIDI